MKLLYDYQIFSLQKFGGISRYFVELMTQFYNNDQVSFEFPLYFSNNEHIRDAVFSNHKTFFPNLRLGIKNKYTRYLNRKNKIVSSELIKQNKFDVFHPTYYDPYFVNFLNNKPFVLTVHDLTSEVFPQYFKNANEISNQKKYLIGKASKIIAISENTKKDLVRYFSTGESKIEVIPLSASFRPTNKEKKITSLKNIPDNYLLFVGNRKVYKNFHSLLKAFSLLCLDDNDINLVCAGGGPFSSKEELAFNKLGISQKIYHIPINDSLLRFLYTNAVAFIFPSLYEGFGIPILEAFECKCPVVLSNSSSFPEVAGKAGLYFDPADPESIKNAIVKIYEDPELREKMISEGTKKLGQYSWQKTAEMTLNVYASIM